MQLHGHLWNSLDIPALKLLNVLPKQWWMMWEWIWPWQCGTGLTLPVSCWATSIASGRTSSIGRYVDGNGGAKEFKELHSCDCGAVDGERRDGWVCSPEVYCQLYCLVQGCYDFTRMLAMPLILSVHRLILDQTIVASVNLRSFTQEPVEMHRDLFDCTNTYDIDFLLNHAKSTETIVKLIFWQRIWKISLTAPIRVSWSKFPKTHKHCKNQKREEIMMFALSFFSTLHIFSISC